MSKIIAPFTPEQVEALNAYQEKGYFHPFTCPGEEDEGDAPCPSRNLIATEAGWVCSCGRYTQDWAHEAMTRPLADPHHLMGLHVPALAEPGSDKP